MTGATEGVCPTRALAELAQALRKYGFPVRCGSDPERGPFVRAWHRQLPIGTDIATQTRDGELWLICEWGHPLCPAADTVTAVAHVVRLLDRA